MMVRHRRKSTIGWRGLLISIERIRRRDAPDRLSACGRLNCQNGASTKECAMRTLMIAALLLPLLAGCSAPNVIVLRDPVTQHLATCHYGPLGQQLAARCASKLQAAGFTEVTRWVE
jgi:hypothetical protein